MINSEYIPLALFERDYAFCRDCPKPLPAPGTNVPGSPEQRFWMGYDRGSDRPEHVRYDSRNYIAMISTVNCSASTGKYISERFHATDLLKKYPNVDGVVEMNENE